MHQRSNHELVVFISASVVLGAVAVGAVAWWRAGHAAPALPRRTHDAPTAHVGYHDYAHDPDAPCTCGDAPRRNGWCRRHDVGWVAGVRVESAIVHDAVDAHGHYVDPDALRCEGCRAAYATDGRCPESGVGFVDGLMYNSPLTYWLATATVAGEELPSCAGCRRHASGSGWCEACGVGRLGPFIFEARSDFDLASIEYRRLGEALTLLPRCELCAGARFTGGICPRCRISYRDGA